MKTIFLAILVINCAMAAFSPKTFKGIDSDKLECSLRFELSEFNEEITKVVINDEDIFIIESENIAFNETQQIKRIKTKHSSLNGFRELVITLKPNNKIDYVVTQIDKVNFEKLSYTCGSLKLTEK